MIPLVYDQVNKWGKDDDFFIEILKKTNRGTLADLGCGTGRLTTHFAKLGFEVTAVDPNVEAIDQAKKKQYADKVKWVIGDSSNLETNAYDVVIMTANVAQVFLTDKSWQQMISDTYRALKPGGHFIFDTRNPLAKVWEEWEQDDTPDLAIHPVTGDHLEIHTEYEGFTGDVFTFFEIVKHVETDEVLIHQKLALRFRTLEELYESLNQIGFTEVQAYDDWQCKQAHSETKSFVFHSVK
ncbi:class I SAM-dependent methyltransferase [Alkalicoccobacillus murimartini]|uniref:2-polyprenyl-3-methyl-5-hydroxy-6-metoxy-1, 4-benzoquinol methylase n=1 Tax=Alkalicoccobacillus murimartini TaxID=171685 RepID=A0ABT9YE61_9BACI|nr:class I SAM-dependent methyltransferase [Alkalicoccobacillus murimartini]MDQ0205831.1 2-polyprenyl-3-methyl-5-hydroxy-6-metoxy-1,4-benzoquinol methylase [Alkalicoccobacillus murimartini]